MDIFPVKNRDAAGAPPAPSGREARNDKARRALAKRREEVDSLLTLKRKRLEAKYGSNPFPEHTQIFGSVVNRERGNRDAEDSREFHDLQVEEDLRLVCSEFEKIVWGYVRPDTASALDRIGQRIDELVNEKRERLQEARRAEEEKKRRRLEAQEEARRRRLEAEEEEQRRRPETEEEEQRRKLEEIRRRPCIR